MTCDHGLAVLIVDVASPDQTTYEIRCMGCLCTTRPQATGMAAKARWMAMTEYLPWLDTTSFTPALEA